MKIKQKERTGATKTVSWTIITALLVLFFPVGIFLMLRKLHSDLNNAASNGKKTAIVGWVFVGLGVFYLSGVLTGQVHAGEDGISSAVLLVLLLCGGGYAMVREGKKYQKLGNDAVCYAELIDRFPEASLDNFAAALSRPYDKVCDDLGKLLALGFFAGCAVDLDNRTLRVPVAQMADAPREAAADGGADANVLVCPNCGGVNAMGDGPAECEYCGSVLR